MARISYSIDDARTVNRWRGAVLSAIRGKRGQAFLKEMQGALNKMERKALICGTFQCEKGVCAIGAVGVARKIDMTNFDITSVEEIARKFGVAPALICEIFYMNDEVVYWNDDTGRYSFVTKWLTENIKK